ncbi:MAG: polyhydroxyalkanoate synthesis repressor PhaR [Pseudomonadota bacterium]
MNETVQDTDETPVLIKKYPNRRLYNTATSSYIVLDDVVELVKSGVSFKIEDTRSGDDLTRSILNQIIYERETAQGNYHFPLDVQKQLILMYDDAYGRMVPEYLRESMKVFVSERDRLKETFEEMLNFNTQTMAQFSENMAKQNMEVFSRTFEFFQNMSGLPTPGAGNKEAAESNPKDAERMRELEDLQKQINSLQQQLKALKQ